MDQRRLVMCDTRVADDSRSYRKRLPQTQLTVGSRQMSGSWLAYSPSPAWHCYLRCRRNQLAEAKEKRGWIELQAVNQLDHVLQSRHADTLLDLLVRGDADSGHDGCCFLGEIAFFTMLTNPLPKFAGESLQMILLGS